MDPERDRCPLWPLPAVFPVPDPTPIPKRLLFLTAPFGGAKLPNFILNTPKPVFLRNFLNFNQMGHDVNHSPDHRCITVLNTMTNAPDSQCFKCQLLLFRTPNGASSLCYSQGPCHEHYPRAKINSCSPMPRRAATDFASRKFINPWRVALTAFCGFCAPRDFVNTL